MHEKKIKVYHWEIGFPICQGETFILLISLSLLTFIGYLSIILSLCFLLAVD